MKRALKIIALLLAASAVLYFYRLDSAPPHTQIDEAMIAINAHAINPAEVKLPITTRFGFGARRGAWLRPRRCWNFERTISRLKGAPE